MLHNKAFSCSDGSIYIVMLEPSMFRNRVFKFKRCQDPLCSWLMVKDLHISEFEQLKQTGEKTYTYFANNVWLKFEI